MSVMAIKMWDLSIIVARYRVIKAGRETYDPNGEELLRTAGLYFAV